MQRVRYIASANYRNVVRPLSSAAGTKAWPKPLKTKQKGVDILHDPLWNKGMGMDYPERDRLNLRGLIPPRVKSLDEQATRIMTQLRAMGPADDADANIQKNMYLQELHNRNETLYHRVLCDNIAELAPLVAELRLEVGNRSRLLLAQRTELLL